MDADVQPLAAIKKMALSCFDEKQRFTAKQKHKKNTTQKNEEGRLPDKQHGRQELPQPRLERGGGRGGRGKGSSSGSFHSRV